MVLYFQHISEVQTLLNGVTTVITTPGDIHHCFKGDHKLSENHWILITHVLQVSGLMLQ